MPRKDLKILREERSECQWIGSMAWYKAGDPPDLGAGILTDAELAGNRL